ncbi:hypothetical protein ABFA07_010528 [Porites harrisoni]
MSIRFDRKYKSWRGPALEEITDESNNREKRHSRGRPSGQSCNPDHTAINKHRARIRNVVRSACYQAANPPPINPRSTSVPAVTWSQPPVEDFKKRRSAFDFGRPSNLYPNDSEEMRNLRRRSHLLFDELQRERRASTRLKREVVRLRDSQGRFGYLVEEIDNLRRENEYIALEIQRRQQADVLSRVNQGSKETLCCAPKQHSRF